MAAAPHILDITSPQVQPTGAPSNDYEHITASPEDFGAIKGKAFEKLGQGIEQASTDATDAWTQAQRFQNSVYVADANGNYTDQATDKWTKFQALQGEDKLRALPQFKADLEDLRQATLKRAGSLEEQSVLANSLRVQQSRFYDWAANEAAKATQQYAVRVAGDNIARYANLAALSWDNGDRVGFETNLRNQDNEARNFAEHQGIHDPDQIEAEVTKRRGATLRTIIETQATTDPNGASALFQQNYNRMDPESRLAVLTKLKPLLQQQNFEIGAAPILGREPPRDAFGGNERMAGLPIGYTARTIQIESRGNPDAISGSHVGLVQGDANWNKRYGVTDPGDPIQVSNALMREAEDNKGQLTPILGRPPTAAELYLAHQQGPGGAAALLADPSRPAWKALRQFYGSDAVAQQAIWGNMSPSMKAQFPGGVGSVSAGDFANLWSARYNRGGESVPIIDRGEAYRRLDAMYGNDPVMWRGVKTIVDHEINFQQTVSAERRGELQVQVPGTIADVRDGNTDKPLPPDLALLGPVASAKYQAEYDSAYREGQARRSMVFASPDEIGALRSSLANGPGADEFRRQDLAAFDKATDERNKLIFGKDGKGGDPAGYVQAYPGVAQAKAKIDPKDPATYENYATRVLALQDHLGVAPQQQHILDVNTAKQMAMSLTQPGADVKGTLDGIAKSTGRYYDAVFRDLVTQGGLSSSYQLVGALDDQNASVLSRWLQGQRNEKGESKTADEILGEAGGKSVASTIRQSIRSNPGLSDLQHSWADSGFSADQIKGLSGAVEDLAYARALYEHADPSTAATGAVEALTGKYTLWSGQGSARVPNEVNDTVRRNAAKVLSDLKEGDLALPNVYGDQAHPGAATAADYLRLVKATPYWVTSPDGKGLMLKDSYLTGSLGRVVSHKNGEPIFIPFAAPLMDETQAPAAAQGASRETGQGFAAYQ